MILKLGQVHFPEVSGVAGDHSEQYARNLAWCVSLDVDLKTEKDCCYVAGPRGEMAGGPANWRHAIEL